MMNNNYELLNMGHNRKKQNPFGIDKIPFSIVPNEPINNKNYELYTQYIQNAIFKSADTLGTTYKTYWDNMKLFFRYLYHYEGNPYILDKNLINNFTDVWERYSYACYMQGNTKVTINKKRTACSTFFDWCIRKKLLFINPFVYIDKLKITDMDKVRKSYFLTPQQIWKIKFFLEEGEYSQKQKDGTIKKIRFDFMDKLIFNLFLDSGARISEVHSLRLSQLDLDNKMFLNVRLKEGYIEPVIFFEGTKKLIEEYIKFKEENNIETDYLLTTYYAGKYKQMQKETIRERVRKIGYIVDIPDFYPHSIRKTILNIAGQENEQLASNLGHHSDIKITRKHYIQKKNAETMRRELENVRSKACL